MTIRYVGGLTAAVAAPHVYLIMSCGCVYIGETQRHPVASILARRAQSDLRSALKTT